MGTFYFSLHVAEFRSRNAVTCWLYVSTECNVNALLLLALSLSDIIKLLFYLATDRVPFSCERKFYHPSKPRGEITSCVFSTKLLIERGYFYSVLHQISTLSKIWIASLSSQQLSSFKKENSAVLPLCFRECQEAVFCLLASRCAEIMNNNKIIWWAWSCFVKIIAKLSSPCRQSSLSALVLLSLSFCSFSCLSKFSDLCFQVS